MGPERLFLIGYGTLLSRESVGSTLGPDAQEKEFLPVVVEGFKRLFNLRPAHYQPSFRVSDEPVEAAAMNVQPAPGFRFNGLAFPVSDVELRALDHRERYYRRVKVEARLFSGGAPPLAAEMYLAAPESPGVAEAPEGLRPAWRDITLARGGAYAVGQAFGEMFDATTYLADGRTLAIDVYRDHLPPLPHREENGP